MDVDVLGSHKSSRRTCGSGRSPRSAGSGRLAPLLEQAEVRLTQDRERPAATRWACHAVLRGHGHEMFGHAEATDPLAPSTQSSRSSSTRWSG